MLTSALSNLADGNANVVLHQPSHAVDAIFAVSYLTVFGMMFAFTTLTGLNYHSMSPVSVRQRYIALGASAFIFVGIPLLTMAYTGITPVAWWNAAFDMKDYLAGDPIMWIAFGLTMVGFAFPALALISVALTEKQRRRERRLITRTTAVY